MPKTTKEIIFENVTDFNLSVKKNISLQTDYTLNKEWYSQDEVDIEIMKENHKLALVIKKIQEDNKSKIEQLRKELKELTETKDFKRMEKEFREYIWNFHEDKLEDNYIWNKIDSIFAKVLSSNSTNLVDNSN